MHIKFYDFELILNIYSCTVTSVLFNLSTQDCLIVNFKSPSRKHELYNKKNLSSLITQLLQCKQNKKRVVSLNVNQKLPNSLSHLGPCYRCLYTIIVLFQYSRKCGLIKGVASLEGNSLLSFYFLNASEICPVMRGDLCWEVSYKRETTVLPKCLRSMMVHIRTSVFYR